MNLLFYASDNSDYRNSYLPPEHRNRLGVFMSPDVNLSIAVIPRLIKEAGAERDSESACRELAQVLEEIGAKIGREALGFAMYAGRRTVRKKTLG